MTPKSLELGYQFNPIVIKKNQCTINYVHFEWKKQRPTVEAAESVRSRFFAIAIVPTDEMQVLCKIAGLSETPNSSA